MGYRVPNPARLPARFLGPIPASIHVPFLMSGHSEEFLYTTRNNKRKLCYYAECCSGVLKRPIALRGLHDGSRWSSLAAGAAHGRRRRSRGTLRTWRGHSRWIYAQEAWHSRL